MICVLLASCVNESGPSELADAVQVTVVSTSEPNLSGAGDTTETTTATAEISNFVYVTGDQHIEPFLGDSAPKKGESRVDPTTGITITRLTDASELPGSEDALIVYSRYTPENISGELVLAFGTNSTTSWVIERATGAIVTELQDSAGNGIGEVHEVRWDTSEQYANRVYFRQGMTFNMIEDVTDPESSPVLIRDFSDLLPNSTQIYNDVEGNSSVDSQQWAWMAAHYDGTTFVVDAFVHYDISREKTDLLRPAMLSGTSLGHRAQDQTLPRPNMVEVSPWGTGIVLHYDRAWGDQDYGNRPQDIDTWFDGPHHWPLDFNIDDQKPVPIAIDATHSGWAYDNENNTYLFVSQNNRTDQIDAVSLVDGYDERLSIAEHEDLGWSNGFHFAAMPNTRPGWTLVSTYSNSTNQTHEADWAADQLLMIRTPRANETALIWRISPTYNHYDGEYRDEAPAAINSTGDRVFLSANWGGMLDLREVFLFELPREWDYKLANS